MLTSGGETRRENFGGRPGHSERKPESKTSLDTEGTARDSFFLQRRR